MKIKDWYFTLSLSFLAFSCMQKNPVIRAATITSITPAILQTCIDSVLALDSKINTETYYVDFGDLKKAYPNLITDYLTEHPQAKVANYDSLVKEKSAWLKNDFRKNDIIQFNSFEQQCDSIIAFNMTKIRYVDASFGAELIFKKQADNFSCIESEITWIN